MGIKNVANVIVKSGRFICLSSFVRSGEVSSTLRQPGSLGDLRSIEAEEARTRGFVCSAFRLAYRFVVVKSLTSVWGQHTTRKGGRSRSLRLTLNSS
jgi:hypothetical protein